MTLLNIHSVQDGGLHNGETSIKPATRFLYFICRQFELKKKSNSIQNPKKYRIEKNQSNQSQQV